MRQDDTLHSHRIYRFLAVLCLSIAIIFFVLAARELWPEVQTNKMNQDLQKAVVQETKNPKSGDTNLERQIDFKKLKKINSDIIGWIYIPGTHIDYPILRGNTLNYYLTHAFDGSYNELGAIFTLPDTSKDLSDQHMFLFGHRTGIGRMFGELAKFGEAEFAKKHSVYLYTSKDARKYSVYAAYQCSKTDETYRLAEDAEEKKAYVANVQEKTPYYDTDVLMDAGDQPILTLSTCPKQGSAYNRFVVQAIRIKMRRRA